MPMSASVLAEKRRRAREAGLCITCCIRHPNNDRSVCQRCIENSYRRKVQQQIKRKQAAEFQQIVAAHEAAGDRARLHYLFDIAAQHYQEALNIAAIVPDDRQRLAEKLGSVSFLTNDPGGANIWRNRMLDSYLDDAAKAEKAVDTLFEITRQMWVDSKTKASLALREEALRIAEKHSTNKFRKFAKLRLVSYWLDMGRFDNARQYLDRLSSIDDTDDPSIRTLYYWKKGFTAAMCGSTIAAYEDLEKAIHCAKDNPDLHLVPVVLEDYAVAAM